MTTVLLVVFLLLLLLRQSVDRLFLVRRVLVAREGSFGGRSLPSRGSSHSGIKARSSRCYCSKDFLVVSLFPNF